MLHDRQKGLNGKKPETCAVTGKPLSPEDAYMDINGVKVGVKGYVFTHMTRDVKDELRAQWAKDIGPGTPKVPASKRDGAKTESAGETPLDTSKIKGE